MNCEQARGLLPELAYADVTGEDRLGLTAHVRDCAGCAAELRELIGLRKLLEAASAGPAARVRVDVPRIYARAAELQRSAARRWRRGALAGMAVAAALLLALVLRVELRWHEQQLVIGWGTPAPRQAVPGERHAPLPPAPVLVASEIDVLRDLIHAMAKDIDSRDRERRAAIVALEKRLDGLSAASDRNWTAARNDLRALYLAYFGNRSKGDIP
jgi:hypothetical protein